MKRRDFIAGAAVLGATSGLSAQGTPQDTKKTPVLELLFFRMRQGDQGRRMSEWISKSVLPIAKKHGFPKPPFGPAGMFNVFIGPSSPMMVQLRAYPSMADREAAVAAMRGDPDFVKSLEALEADAEPPFDRLDSMLLQATPFSPVIAVADEARKPPRFFELRIYEADTQKRLVALNKRFGEHEVSLFKKAGLNGVFFANTVIGANMPNLTYMLAFDTWADREKAWAAFQADPDWVKVRDASVQASGQIVSRITSMVLRPTAYSPIQ